MGPDRVLAALKELTRHPDGVALDELTRRGPADAVDGTGEALGPLKEPF